MLQTQQTLSLGELGAIPATTTYSDYREVGGRRVPYRYITTTEPAGRVIFQVDKVEPGIKLAPDFFAIPPSGGSGRGAAKP